MKQTRTLQKQQLQWLRILILCIIAAGMLPILGQEVYAAQQHVGNYEQLSAVIEGVNDGSIPADTDIILDQDITVPETVGNAWVPLAKDAAHAYQGTFDGRGHSITGIRVDRSYPKSWTAGEEVHNFTSLVSFLGKGGTVKDLKVKAQIRDVNDVAGIVSQNYGTIDGCSFEGTLVSDAYPNQWDEHPVAEGEQYFDEYNSEAGCIAALNEGTIKDCVAGSEETLNAEDGSSIDRGGASTGGICGLQGDGGTVTGCTNFAAVICRDTKYEVIGYYESGGGICGQQGPLRQEAVSQPEITDCVNHGSVSGDSAFAGICGISLGGNIRNCINDGNMDGAGNGHSAGIAGTFQSIVGFPSELSGCSNRGNVTFVSAHGAAIGGIIGYLAIDIDPETMEAVPARVFNCRNDGDITGANRVGGIIGLFDNGNDSSPVYNNVNTGCITGENGVGGIAGGSPGIIAGSINLGEIKAVKGKTDAEVCLIGGIVGDLSPNGSVYESYNLGKIQVSNDIDLEILAGGVAGYCRNPMVGCYYCIDTAGDAGSATGYDPDSFEGALTLREMTGTAAAENMKDMMNDGSGCHFGTSWHTGQDIVKDGVTYAMPPQFDEVPITLDDVLASGADPASRWKTDLSSARVSMDQDRFIFTGSAIQPKLTVTFKGNTLEEGRDYEIYGIFNNVMAGEATVVLTGIRDYSGAKVVWFDIDPAKAGIAKLTSGKKKLTVKMSGSPSAYGGTIFQIQYRVKGTSAWKSVKSSKQSVVIKNLKKGKKYQVRAGALSTFGTNTYAGAWSAVKTVKIKK